METALEDDGRGALSAGFSAFSVGTAAEGRAAWLCARLAALLGYLFHDLLLYVIRDVRMILEILLGRSRP